MADEIEGLAIYSMNLLAHHGNLSKPAYNTCNLVKARSYIKMNKFMVNLLTPSTLVGRPIVNSTNTHQ